MSEERILEKLDRLEQQVAAMRDLLERNAVRKEWYSTEQAAAYLKKAPYTVREWCRHERIRAKKANSGHGKTKDWLISHDELERFEREGLLPIKCGIQGRQENIHSPHSLARE